MGAADFPKEKEDVPIKKSTCYVATTDRCSFCCGKKSLVQRI